jgi:hypothetical protein
MPAKPVLKVDPGKFAVKEGPMLPASASSTTLTFTAKGNKVTMCLCYTFIADIMGPNNFPPDKLKYGVFTLDSSNELTDGAPLLSVTTNATTNMAAITTPTPLGMTGGVKGEHGNQVV